MLFAVIFILTIIFIYLLKNNDQNKIFDIYSRPGKWYWVKYVLILTVLQLRKLRTKNSRNIFELEKLQPLSEHEKVK